MDQNEIMTSRVENRELLISVPHISSFTQSAFSTKIPLIYTISSGKIKLNFMQIFYHEVKIDS